MNPHDIDEVIAALVAMHKPAHIEDPMVYEVWNDGEVTLTKGGDLYGQRNLHMTEFGFEGAPLPVEAFPQPCLRYKHARIVVANREEALAARELIRAFMVD